MSMGMSSLVLAKPSTCINIHAITNSNNPSLSLALSSRSTFNPLQGFHYYGSSWQGQRRSAVTVRSSISPIPVPPPTPPPSSTSSASSGFPGKGWIAGIVLSLLLPFLKNKWGPLFVLKEKLEQKLQTIEDVVEALEKVADRVDNAAENFGKSLPEGSLKNAVQKIESVAERVELAAHLTDQAIDKIQELEDEMDIFDESNQTKSSQLNEEKIDSKPA